MGVLTEMVKEAKSKKSKGRTYESFDPLSGHTVTSPDIPATRSRFTNMLLGDAYKYSMGGKGLQVAIPAAVLGAVGAAVGATATKGLVGGIGGGVAGLGVGTLAGLYNVSARPERSYEAAIKAKERWGQGERSKETD